MDSELEDHKQKWLQAQKDKIPLKSQLKVLSKIQSTAKQFFTSWMEDHDLTTLDVGEGHAVDIHTTEKVLWKESLLQDLFDDPSDLAEYKELNRVVKRSVGVKKRKLETIS
jgi:hypothetical protein|tara:strand:- start:129 stop:461 length:333 start_codon:yes stop_codon:yes gene_type:complete